MDISSRVISEDLTFFNSQAPKVHTVLLFLAVT